MVKRCSQFGILRNNSRTIIRISNKLTQKGKNNENVTSLLPLHGTATVPFDPIWPFDTEFHPKGGHVVLAGDFSLQIKAHFKRVQKKSSSWWGSDGIENDFPEGKNRCIVLFALQLYKKGSLVKKNAKNHSREASQNLT